MRIQINQMQLHGYNWVETKLLESNKIPFDKKNQVEITELFNQIKQENFLPAMIVVIKNHEAIIPEKKSSIYDRKDYWWIHFYDDYDGKDRHLDIYKDVSIQRLLNSRFFKGKHLDIMGGK